MIHTLIACLLALSLVGCGGGGSGSSSGGGPNPQPKPQPKPQPTPQAHSIFIWNKIAPAIPLLTRLNIGVKSASINTITISPASQNSCFKKPYPITVDSKAYINTQPYQEFRTLKN